MSDPEQLPGRDELDQTPDVPWDDSGALPSEPLAPAEPPLPTEGTWDSTQVVPTAHDGETQVFRADADAGSPWRPTAVEFPAGPPGAPPLPAPQGTPWTTPGVGAAGGAAAAPLGAPPGVAPSGNPWAPPPYGGPGGSAPYGAPGEPAPNGGPGGSAPYGGPGGPAPYGGPGGPVPYGAPGGSAPYGGPGGPAPYGGPGGSAPYGAPWTAGQSPRRKSRAVLWIVLGGVAVLAAVGVAVAWLIGGQEPDLEQLYAQCELGSADSCDDLYQQAPVGSPEEAFGLTCGGRTDGFGDCADVMDLPANSWGEATAPDDDGADPGTEGGVAGEPYTYGDDEYFDGLWDKCEAGDMVACDDLFWESPSDSGYEEFGDTCGGTAAGGEWCDPDREG